MLVWIQNPFDNLPAEGFRKQRYWLMAEAFVRAGHSVVYWTSDFSHATKEKRDEGRRTGDEDRGIEVRFVPTLPYGKNVSLARIRSHCAYARDWLRLVLSSSSPVPRPALVISSCPTLSAAAAALKIGRAFSSKVVIDVQDAWPETFERLVPKRLRGLARLALSPLRAKARRIYRAADLVTGVCDAYRDLTGRQDYYRAFLGIEGLADTGRETENGGRETRLVYAGGLGKTYDLATVVKAVEANEEMTLDVAGFGDFACGCPRVRFHGALSAADLRNLFASCEIGVIPMEDDSCVGFPNKIFDYAAAGLGIVSSLGGESAALLRKWTCGATYRAGDAASFAAAVRQARALPRGASRTMCADAFDARKIYDSYVSHVVNRLCSGRIVSAVCVLFFVAFGQMALAGNVLRTYTWTHPRFVEVQLVDATDRHNELYFEREYLLLPNEAPMTNAAPAVFIEDSVTGDGFACLRLGPLPHARADKSPDYVLTPGRRRLEYLTNAYPFVEKAYTGGRLGRIRALRQIQREIRPYVSDRDGMLLTNTWGDGNRDACVNEAFLLREVERGVKLGVDVIQIDDGWQAGRTANSSAIRNRAQGRWGSYWDQPGFWDFDPVRFPNGVKPVVEAARARGMKFGLWFGPDSSDEARFWRKDADFLLGLHRDLGIDYFKLDSMRSQTARALGRQRALMSALMDGSQRRITVDLDVTAGIRPGYFGFVDIGPVFVENRYARAGDARLWWPHLTLRNLWSLAHAVDSVRLRMEFLNPKRHPELYGDDPLAPDRYPADAIFAGVMAGSPLGWFEIQNLSPETVAAWKPLVATWKRERAAWYAGEMYPVGGCPDGFAWTGFVSAAQDGRSGYALVFRELSDEASFTLPLKGMLAEDVAACTVIAGRGSASLAGGRLRVEVPAKLDFVWVKIGAGK